MSVIEGSIHSDSHEFRWLLPGSLHEWHLVLIITIEVHKFIQLAESQCGRECGHETEIGDPVLTIIIHLTYLPTIIMQLSGLSIIMQLSYVIIT